MSANRKEPLIGPEVAYPTPWRMAEEREYGHVIACATGHQAAAVWNPELGELICELVNAAGDDPDLIARLRKAKAGQEQDEDERRWTP